MKLKSIVHSHRNLFLFMALLIGNAIFFAIVAYMFDMRYEENDDVIMCMIANGVYNGTPDCHLIFINALYGYVVSGLYKILPIIEWYALLFAAFHILSMSTITYITIKDSRHNKWIKIAFCCFLYALWVRNIICFQFTTTAAMLCFAGGLALLASDKKRWIWMGGIFIIIAALIRFQAAALTFVFLFPLLVPKFVRNRRFIIYLCTIFLAVLACLLCDKLFYRTPDWKNYCDQNEQRLAINDTRTAELTEEQMPSGINYEDFKLVKDFFADPQVMGADELAKINHVRKANITVKSALANIHYLSAYRVQILAVILGLLLCFLGQYKSPKRIHEDIHEIRLKGYKLEAIIPLYYYLLPIIFILLFLGFSCYIEGVMLMKNRVMICILYPLVYNILYCSPKNLSKPFVFGIVAILLCLSCKYLVQGERIYQKNQEVIENIERYQYSLVADKHDYYICGLNINYISPFRINNFPVRIIELGWMAGVPFNIGVLENHADFVDSNILLLNRIGNPPDNLVESIKRNYGIQAHIEVLDSNDKYALYQLKSISNLE